MIEKRRHSVWAILLVVCLLSNLSTQAQDNKTFTYKSIDTVNLSVEMFYPKGYDQKQSYPAIIFFFGGGWVRGTTEQFRPHAEYLSSLGMFCFLADYRVSDRHQTTAFESLMDAKSAVRFVKSLGSKYSIDTTRIVASGGSAGGHLAAATAIIEGYNDPADDLSIDCKPDALVLFNPVIDNGPGGYGFDRIGDAYKDFSPLHNITKEAPPTIFFLGTKDNLIPVETAEYYRAVMEKVGSQCNLFLYEGQGHGFFNYRNKEYYDKTVGEMEGFLKSLRYLD